jgi:glycosyltransferase involved in cell wall biosynthesis
MPRILHVIPALAARYGGPSIAAVGMCRALTRAGVETLIVTTDADGPGRLNVPIGQVTDTSGIPTIYFRRRGSDAYKWAQGLSAWLTGHVREFDLVHVHAVFSHASMAAGQAAQAAGVPFVVRPLGTLDPWSVARHGWRKRALFGIGLRRTLEAASAMHYTTRAEQQLAESAQPWLPRGVVVPLGVDDGLFEAGECPDPSQPYVLAMSRLDPKKGTDLLIRAFNSVCVRPSGARWRLVIAGDGQEGYVNQLKALASAGPGAPRVVFPGWVDGPRREWWLRHASIFTLPSAQENFGIALGEAMACGVPVVVTPGVNLAAEIAAAGAGWAVERSVEALAAALHTAVTDGAERARRGLAARKLAEQFRWAAVARALEAFYATVTAGALVEAR